MMAINNITTEQIENIVIDAGAVYLNYGKEGERLLAPCRGANQFSVESEVREIEANGFKGKTKGARRKIKENASLEVNLMDLSLENLKMALPGSKLSENKLTNGFFISLEDYLDNVTLIGEDMSGKFKKITIFNVLVDEPVTISMDEDDESVVAIKFAAHYDPSDESGTIWTIEDLTELAEKA